MKDNEAAGVVRFRDLKEPADEHMGILLETERFCACAAADGFLWENMKSLKITMASNMLKKV